MMNLKTFNTLLGYTFERATCVLNVLPSISIASTPYAIWKGKKANLSYFRVWGCLAHVKKYDTNKLESRTEFCRFVGYSRETIWYYFYCREEQSIFAAKRVILSEGKYLLRRDTRSCRSGHKFYLIRWELSPWKSSSTHKGTT